MSINDRITPEQVDRGILSAASKNSEDWDDATWAAWWRTAERAHQDSSKPKPFRVAADGTIASGPICTQEEARAAGLDVAPGVEELTAIAESIVRSWGDRFAEPDDLVASTADAGAQLARAVPLVLAELNRLRIELTATTTELVSAQDQWERHASEAAVRTVERDQARAELAARQSRADILREAADEIAGIDFHPNARARSLDIASGLATRLRRMADEVGMDAHQGANKLDKANRFQPAQELTVYRASHDSIVMGLYTTAAAAREHCEADMRREFPKSRLSWIVDEEDGVAELYADAEFGDPPTGYVVTPLTVAAAYDEEAGE